MNNVHCEPCGLDEILPFIRKTAHLLSDAITIDYGDRPTVEVLDEAHALMGKYIMSPCGQNVLLPFLTRIMEVWMKDALVSYMSSIDSDAELPLVLLESFKAAWAKEMYGTVERQEHRYRTTYAQDEHNNPCVKAWTIDDVFF